MEKNNKKLLIYPEIGEYHNFEHILLIDDTVPSYQIFVDSVNSHTFPIVYSTKSSKKELLEFLQNNFNDIQRIAICFAISTSGDAQTFLDNKPLFLDDEVEPNNKDETYSSNVEFMLNLIEEFNVSNIDYLGCNSLKYQNWVDYFELLQEKTNVIIGASDDETGNIKYGGDWTMENTNTNIEYIYFKKSIEYYNHLLDISQLYDIISGNYERIEYEGNYVISFLSDAKIKFNWPITVNYIIVGGGGGGGAGAYTSQGGSGIRNASGGGSGGSGGQIITGSFKSIPSYIADINVGDGGAGQTGIAASVLDSYGHPYVSYDSSYSPKTGSNGGSSSIKYNSKTYTAIGGYAGIIGRYYNSSNGAMSAGNGTIASYTYTSSTGSRVIVDSSDGGGGYGGGYVGSIDVSGGEGAVSLNSVYYFNTDFGSGGGGGGVGNGGSSGERGNSYAGTGGYNIANNNIFYSRVFPTSTTKNYGGGGGGGAGAFDESNGGQDGVGGSSSGGSGGSGRVVLWFSKSTSVITNICFPADTPVLTDQGIIAIQKIDPKVNTIDNKKIVAITESISQDDYLVCFKKHCLGYNYPSEDTVMTKEHKIKYDKQMVEADNFLGYIDNVKKVDYNGEILYNVLMEKYEKINVNNLICETLHPQNKIAKIYNSKFSEDYKNKLIRWTNDNAIKYANDKLLEYENEQIMLKELEKMINQDKNKQVKKFNHKENGYIVSKIQRYAKNKKMEDIKKIVEKKEKLTKKNEESKNEKTNNEKTNNEKTNNEKTNNKKTNNEKTKEINAHNYTQKPIRHKLTSKNITYKR
jgi:hypothetical protein